MKARKTKTASRTLDSGYTMSRTEAEPSCHVSRRYKDKRNAYLVQVILASLGIIDGRLIAIVTKMACSNKTVAACAHISAQPKPRTRKSPPDGEN